MLVTIGALLLSYILPLTLYFFLRAAHGDDAAYKKDCRSLLLNGLLLGFPVFGFSLLCGLLFRLTRLGDAHPLLELLFKNFVMLALSEELMKYLSARRIINKNRAQLSFLDLMAYTMISAIGFELMESAVYLFTSSVPQVLVRGVTNMHAVFGMIMGFLLASLYRKGSRLPLLPALLIPTLIHGLYDLGVSERFVNTPLGGVSLLLAVLCLGLNIAAFFFFRKKRRDPRFTAPLFPQTEGDGRDPAAEEA